MKRSTHVPAGIDKPGNIILHPDDPDTISIALAGAAYKVNQVVQGNRPLSDLPLIGAVLRRIDQIGRYRDDVQEVGFADWRREVRRLLDVNGHEDFTLPSDKLMREAWDDDATAEQVAKALASVADVADEAMPAAPFTEYEHHGHRVVVRSELKGRHREHCLCFAPCQQFKPGQPDNCGVAADLFAKCQQHGVVTPVWECPRFMPAVDPAAPGEVAYV